MRNPMKDTTPAKPKSHPAWIILRCNEGMPSPWTPSPST
jgi:hypothetical protein